MRTAPNKSMHVIAPKATLSHRRKHITAKALRCLREKNTLPVPSLTRQWRFGRAQACVPVVYLKRAAGEHGEDGHAHGADRHGWGPRVVQNVCAQHSAREARDTYSQ